MKAARLIDNQFRSPVLTNPAANDGSAFSVFALALFLPHPYYRPRLVLNSN